MGFLDNLLVIKLTPYPGNVLFGLSISGKCHRIVTKWLAAGTSYLKPNLGGGVQLRPVPIPGVTESLLPLAKGAAEKRTII